MNPIRALRCKWFENKLDKLEVQVAFLRAAGKEKEANEAEVEYNRIFLIRSKLGPYERPVKK